MSIRDGSPPRTLSVALAGNPNVGKTSLFNVLTGSRHYVANYPGATVERREGDVLAKYAGERAIRVVDLPGTYSLTALAEDEAVAFRLLAGIDGPKPDAVLLVLDASNLARNLYLAVQIQELGLPFVVALNMIDVAATAGLPTDAATLSHHLGVPVVPTIARTGTGAAELTRALLGLTGKPVKPTFVEPPPTAATLRSVLEQLSETMDPAKARWAITCAAADTLEIAGTSEADARRILAAGSAKCRTAAHELITCRYARVDELLHACGHADAVRHEAPVMSASTQVDRILTHRIFGLLTFVSVMALVFVAIFSWAEPLMKLIEAAVAIITSGVTAALPPGLFTDLLTEGVIAGVGNVLVFLPQIALLFLFIGLLEDTGYLARAAFLLDRLMWRLGLHGRAFIPLLSGYACAIPAILGTRTISSWRDRLVTILMIPYMSCSARLPIYALVIGALFVSPDPWISESVDRGLVLLAMYLLSTVSALLAGFIYKRTILRSPTPPLVLELPPYRIPRLRNIGLQVYERSRDFVSNAGTMILACTIVLWALLSFPREATHAGAGQPTRIAESYGGRAARALEPVLQPIGQDWRIGVGIIGSFAAREVLVSTLGLVYGMEADDDDPVELRRAMREDIDPDTGRHRHTPLSGLALMVFFVYACQCMSTLAVVRRETRSWGWPVFMFVSMTSIAYLAALIVYQGGRWLGFE